MDATYLATARLLVDIAPTVFEGDQFALKGGTAINLFLRDMPRLSVDLDVVFVDHRLSRSEALAAINARLRAIGDRLTSRGFAVRVASTPDAGETKLFVKRDDLVVKVEVNTVTRGTIRQTGLRSLTPAASDALLADVDVRLLDADEIYGGKLVAAMDRQHPRDLFDVMQLFEHGGITPGIRSAFVVYLAGHHRTIHEVLFPTAKNLTLAYHGALLGMTSAPVALESLLDARRSLFDELPRTLDGNEREFLRTLVRAQPDWSLLGIPHLADLPAIRWRLQNLEQLSGRDPKRFNALAEELDRRFAKL